MNNRGIRNIKPTLAYLTDNTPNTNNWLHEVKFDGYRLLCIIKNKAISLITRNGKDWSKKMPTLIRALKTFPLKNTVLDGEIVMVDSSGLSNFELLQNAFSTKKETQIKFFVFDLPYFDGNDLTHYPLIKRKLLLKKAFVSWKAKHEQVILTQYAVGNGKAIFEQSCKMKLEGIVSKEKNSDYLQKRTNLWLKSKCVHRQEFVIGGFTKPKGNRKYFGALLLGVMKNRKLLYCGKVGTGFTEHTLFEIYNKLKSRVKKEPPFENLNNIAKKESIWVTPNLICEISFLEWTEKSLLRHSVFLSLRSDKKASEVSRERSM